MQWRGVADLFPRGWLTDFEAARRRPSLRGGEPYEGAGLGLREGKPGRHLGRPSRRRRRSAPWLNEQLVWWKGSADELRIVSPRAENGHHHRRRRPAPPPGGPAAARG